MLKLLLTPLLLLLVLLHSPAVSGQSPAPSPGPPALPNVTAILEKGGHFTRLIRLLKHTQMDDRLYRQLNNSEDGVTVFAPTDAAFTNLRKLNVKQITEKQRLQLLQFHVVPSFLGFSEFDTIINPLNTMAGTNAATQFPLNVTTAGNQVMVSTGVVNTTVSDTLYTDGKLAVYQVDQVLLPRYFFPELAPAPAPVIPEKVAPPPVEPSGAVIRKASGVVSLGAFVVAASAFCL
ncbi:hypothetical protein NMG60_11000521 [Bertholletia excelsa]